MLSKINPVFSSLSPEVGSQVRPEVVVEPAKVHLPEVPRVVHVAEVVGVGGGAQGQDHTLLAALHVDPATTIGR